MLNFILFFQKGSIEIDFSALSPPNSNVSEDLSNGSYSQLSPMSNQLNVPNTNITEKVIYFAQSFSNSFVALHGVVKKSREYHIFVLLMSFEGYMRSIPPPPLSIYVDFDLHEKKYRRCFNFRFNKMQLNVMLLRFQAFNLLYAF